MRRQLFFLLLVAIINWPAFCRDFSEKEITVRATDGVAMGATLTLPDDEPKAAVILATGSGIQNRDEEIFGKKPFRTISEFLSANGYAVLRMDDRGFSSSSIINHTQSSINIFSFHAITRTQMCDKYEINHKTFICA